MEDKLYSYIEYKKDDRKSIIIEKGYSSSADYENIYILAENGGELKPSTINKGILSSIQEHSLDIEYTNGDIDEEEWLDRIENGLLPSSVNMYDILSYLESKGYKRIIIIDFS